VSEPETLEIDLHLVPANAVLRAVRFGDEMPARFAEISLPSSLDNALARRRIEFAAGRYCAREALRACAREVAHEAVNIGDEREPIWPRGVIGSIAHTRGIAAALVARDRDWRGVGIDIERAMDDAAVQRIGPKIVAARELEPLVVATGWRESEVLTLVFSAKESIYKALHREVRRYFGFHAARVERIDLAARTWRATIREPLTVNIAPGFVCEGRFAREHGVFITTMAVGKSSSGASDAASGSRP
jgi:enterobactin synthetase component D